MSGPFHRKARLLAALLALSLFAPLSFTFQSQDDTCGMVCCRRSGKCCCRQAGGPQKPAWKAPSECGSNCARALPLARVHAATAASAAVTPATHAPVALAVQRPTTLRLQSVSRFAQHPRPPPAA